MVIRGIRKKKPRYGSVAIIEPHKLNVHMHAGILEGFGIASLIIPYSDIGEALLDFRRLLHGHTGTMPEVFFIDAALYKVTNTRIRKCFCEVLKRNRIQGIILQAPSGVDIGRLPASFVTIMLPITEEKLEKLP